MTKSYKGVGQERDVLYEEPGSSNWSFAEILMLSVLMRTIIMQKSGNYGAVVGKLFGISFLGEC